MHIDDASDCRTLDELDNEELAVRAQGGSLASFDLLVQRFEGRLYNFLLRRVGNPSDAEELAQETFVRAWRSIERYRPTHRFSTWLFTIGTRLSINHLRSARVRLASDAEPAPQHSDDPASPVERAEDWASLWSMVDESLTESQRTALWLRYAEDLPMHDIARILGKTSVGVRALLFRARSTLIERLESTSTSTRGPAPCHPSSVSPLPVEVEA